MKSKLLITGGNGQLAACLKDLSSNFPEYEFLYTDYAELDITDFNNLRDYFKEHSIQWCVNCAAYTAVDKAESEKGLASSVNEFGAENLAKICNEFHVKLIHISTDFVFDGKSSKPYLESDSTSPLSVYGETKRQGELAVQNHLHSYFIIRTSWLYSEHGNNFLKTMLRLSETRPELNVVADQIGTPTYAGDLAALIMKIIGTNSEAYGLYHYSNDGVASWFDFAKTIFKFTDSVVKIKPIPTTEYPTPAQRPKYSVLDKSKIKKTFKLTIPEWEDSLQEALKKIK